MMHDVATCSLGDGHEYLHALAERIAMGASMFETACTLALASLTTGLPEQEVRRRLCERFYGALAERLHPGAGR